MTSFSSKMSIRLACVVSLFCLTFLPSCVTNKEFDYLNDQVVTVKNRVDRLEEGTGGKISTDVASVQGNQARLSEDIEGIRREMGKLTGQTEENRHLIKRVIEKDMGQVEATRAGVSDLSHRVAQMEERIRRMEQVMGLAATPQQEKPTAEQPAPTKPDVKPTPPTSPPQAEQAPSSGEKKAYDGALAAFNQGKYEEAISGFKGFVKDHPKSELADNAQFWIGECYMSLKQYEQAILAYQEVIKKYPKGNKVPNAMLRQAIAFAEIKDKMSAKLLLNKVIKNYPNSLEAKVAETKLKTLQ